ncbi:ABC transporter permease [Mycetocola miduiensis]|uniref:Monosaccharide ABC transporter membrane protein, CUT2 family n=1 Tax=Mycetocola miduiensis TaxID=995034 RepID=A0A1I5C5H7_9MICO|nr:ABC transporter permease [Mycetocola miduiensis]SFN82187.1 monosaccharide ABC transporter membrane protein, CUT2 family [Mycetocola miduiensis]
MDVIRRLRGSNNEGVLALVLVGFIVAMSIANPTFFTLNTGFSILRSSIVPVIFALGVLIVVVTGGIDVSFAAIAIFAGYATVSFCLNMGFDPGILGIFAIAVGVGSLLGLINGIVIARFNLPTLIVTLGTQGVFFGAMYTYVGAQYYAELPGSMAALATSNLLDVTTSAGRAYLHVLVVPVLLLCVLVAWVLKRTMFGRSLYAIGGDIEAARRAGFLVKRTQVWVYVMVGALAAVAGIVHIVLSRSANPRDLVGGELDIIAAVVLGGASIFGGRGSVIGTVLGVLLVQVIKNSLLLVGVPSAWLRTAVGILLVLGVGIQAVAARRDSRQKRVIDEVDAEQKHEEKVES